MKYKFSLTKGKYLYEWCFIPTIRFETGDNVVSWITLEWFKWYIGFTIINKEEERKSEIYLREWCDFK